MKYDKIYLHLTDLEFVEDTKRKWVSIFEKFYRRILRQQRKRRLERLLDELKDRRKRIDELIRSVQLLKALVDDAEISVEYCKFEETYLEIIDKLFCHISRDISYFIYDIASMSKETNDEICPDEVATLINYKISTGIKEYFDCQLSKKQYDLKRCNYKFYMYFCDEKSIYTKIYQQAILQKYNELYSIVLDKQQIDLELLSNSENTNLSQGALQSEMYSDLFRSILSKYIFLWREKNHVTQNELSKRSGVDRTMIAKIEKLQQTASVDTTIKLLNTVGANLLIVPQG